jgi:hypothetical protein
VLGAAIGGVVALAVVAGLLVWFHRGDPGDVVRQYLSAIRAKDTAKALRVAGVKDPPTGEAARFLTADAIMGGWEVDTVSKEDPDSFNVYVDVTLRPTGRGVFELEHHGRGWRIVNPFVEVRLGYSGFSYFEINDLRVAARQREARYLLFPGIYTPYTRHEDLMKPTTSPLVGLAQLLRRRRKIRTGARRHGGRQPGLPEGVRRINGRLRRRADQGTEGM